MSGSVPCSRDQVDGDRRRKVHADGGRRRRSGAHRAEAQEEVLRRDHHQRGGRQAQAAGAEGPLQGGLREALQGEVRQDRLLQGVQGQVREGVQGEVREALQGVDRGGLLLLRPLLQDEPGLLLHARLPLLRVRPRLRRLARALRLLGRE
jgi:hypothetical protein